MHVGQNVKVVIETYVGESQTALTAPVKKLVTGKVEYVHPEGRFATVRVPKGYCVTIYPIRRAGKT